MAKTKAQKRKTKRKAYEHDRNIANNQAKARFRLDVNFGEKGGGWKSMAGFKTVAQCEAYRLEQEAIREEGDTEILEGVIIDIRTNKQVARIPPFKPDTPETLEDVKKVEPKGFLSDVKSANSEDNSKKIEEGCQLDVKSAD